MELFPIRKNENERMRTNEKEYVESAIHICNDFTGISEILSAISEFSSGGRFLLYYGVGIKKLWLTFFTDRLLYVSSDICFESITKSLE